MEKFLRHEKVKNFREGDYGAIVINGTSPAEMDHFFKHLEIDKVNGWRSIKAIAENSDTIKTKIINLRKGRAETIASIEEDEREIELIVDFYERYVSKCKELGFPNGIGRLSLLEKNLTLGG